MKFPVTHLIIHHSASPPTTTFEQIRTWHLKRGWVDIGYHWVIEGNGTLKHGRAAWTTGAHVLNQNQSKWGVCVVGNNTRQEQRWNDSQLSTLRAVVYACRLVAPQIKVVGHRDLPHTATECPGLDIRALGISGV
jgi:hypothetical protein